MLFIRFICSVIAALCPLVSLNLVCSVMWVQKYELKLGCANKMSTNFGWN